MVRKRQHYKLIEYNPKDKIAKVLNFRTKDIEIYSTLLDKNERLNKRIAIKRREKRKEREKKKKEEYLANFLRIKRFLKYHKNYSNSSFLAKNNLFSSLIIDKFFNYFKDKVMDKNMFFSVYKLGFDNLNRKIYHKDFLEIISIYIILCRSNIFITLVKNNKVFKVFSSGIFRHIPKRGRKNSASFFYTVKIVLKYLNRFIFYRKKKFFFKIYFKGFQKFRRPLISRFLYNKRFKYKCLGIYNLDFEVFNGCRLRKKKRIKIRGQRKQKKNFSL